MPDSRIFDSSQTQSGSEAEQARRTFEENSRYRWNTVVSISRHVATVFIPPVTGSEYLKYDYTFMGFMPDGEIRDLIIGFERKLSGNITQNITYGPADKLDISLVYRNRNLDWLEDNASVEKEEVLAQIHISDDPLKFMDDHVYRLSPSDSTEDGARVQASPSSIPDYLRALWLKFRYNTDDSSATNHMMGNVANIHVTAIFGSYPSAGQSFGFVGAGSQQASSIPQPFLSHSPLGNL